MSKEEFLKKYNLTENDYLNLKKYEKVRVSGVYNMHEYMGLLEKYNINGGKHIVDTIKIKNLYDDFLLL